MSKTKKNQNKKTLVPCNVVIHPEHLKYISFYFLPDCPDCGEEMGLKAANDEKHYFWGCKMFPACSGYEPFPLLRQPKRT
jgi:hypothetical protein